MSDRTHWQGCWREHHECAVANIWAMRELLSDLDRSDLFLQYEDMRCECDSSVGYTCEKCGAEMLLERMQIYLKDEFAQSSAPPGTSGEKP